MSNILGNVVCGLYVTGIYHDVYSFKTVNDDLALLKVAVIDKYIGFN